MRSEAEIREEKLVVAQLAENAPRDTKAERRWRARAEALAWVLGEGDDDE